MDRALTFPLTTSSMSKKDEIARLEKKIKASGKPVPANLKEMSEDDQIITMELIVGDEGEEQEKVNGGTEFKGIGPTEVKAMLGAIKDLQKQIANNKEEYDKKLSELSGGGNFGASGSRYNEDFIKMMREINRPDHSKDGIIPMEFANAEDKCDPVTFFGTKSKIKIGVIEVGGQRLSPPNNNEWVVFQNDFWFRDPFTGKLHVRCHYTTQSKAMAEYLRKSNKYRVEIFEDTNEASAVSENSYWADIRDQHLQAIKGRPEHLVVQQAMALGISIGSATDHFAICKLLAEKEADAQIASEKAGADSLRPEGLIMRAKPIVTA